MTDCTSLTDQDLLQLMSEDNAPAFKEVYDRHWKNVYCQAYRRLRSEAAAEEIVQDIFLTLWQKRKTLSINSLPHYLSAMCRYAVFHFFAMERKPFSSRQIEDMEFILPDTANSLLDNKLKLDLVKKVSNNLPERCRQVFIYNKIEDLSLPQVAEKLNISLKTAEAHLTKALRIIRMSIRF